MKRTLLIRLGGLAAMVGAVAYALANLALWSAEPQIIRQLDMNKTIQTIDNICFVFLVVGALVSIAALHILHREFYRMLATLVALAAFVGMVLVLVGGLGDVLRPWWHSMPPIFTLTSWSLQLAWQLAILGGIGLGAVTLVARVLPWWCGVALIVGSLLFAPASLFGEVFAAVVGVAWALVGYAIFRAGARHAEQPSRVR